MTNESISTGKENSKKIPFSNQIYELYCAYQAKVCIPAMTSESLEKEWGKYSANAQDFKIKIWQGDDILLALTSDQRKIVRGSIL